MTTTNVYFNNLEHSGQQNLVEDLIIESIKIYGHEIYYLPRTLTAENTLLGEDRLSKFESAYAIEVYIKNLESFEGQGDILSKFNIEIRDQIVFQISQRRWKEEVYFDDTHQTQIGNTGDYVARPNEGDLIFFPLNGGIFEIKYIEDEVGFYQLGSLAMYEFTCEQFAYSHEEFNTGIAEIDAIETTHSSNVLNFQILDEAGNIFVLEDGSSLVQEGYRLEDTDKFANNEFFATSTNIDFIDFSEGNPFSEGTSW